MFYIYMYIAKVHHIYTLFRSSNHDINRWVTMRTWTQQLLPTFSHERKDLPSHTPLPHCPLFPLLEYSVYNWSCLTLKWAVSKSHHSQPGKRPALVRRTIWAGWWGSEKRTLQLILQCICWAKQIHQMHTTVAMVCVCLHACMLL